MLDKKLLEILACPKCKSPVREEGDKLICVNPDCSREYEIKDGIPIMIIEDEEDSEAS